MNDPISEPLAPPDSVEREVPAPEVSVVIVVSEEDAEIDVLYEATAQQLREGDRTNEFVFVLDGVGGAALDKLEALRLQGEPVRIVIFEHPFGESLAFAAGFQQARGDILLTMPQYLQIDPLEVQHVLSEIDQGMHMVSPWRRPRVDPWLNRAQSTIFNVLLRVLIPDMHFHDLNCNFRALRREVIEEISIYGELYRFLPVMAMRQGFRVVEIPVRHLKEWGRSGFFGLGVYLRRFLDVLTILFLTKFALRPLRFFGIIGSVLGSVGASVLVYMAYGRWLRDLPLSMAEERPLFVFGITMLVLGVQLVGFGLVGEIIIFTQARHLKEYKVERVLG